MDSNGCIVEGRDVEQETEKSSIWRVFFISGYTLLFSSGNQGFATHYSVSSHISAGLGDRLFFISVVLKQETKRVNMLKFLLSKLQERRARRQWESPSL